MSSVEEMISRVPAIVGVSAKHLETGAEVHHNADDVFLTASTFKVPLLVELLSQVDAGKIALARRIELTDDQRTPGSGVFKQLGAGLQPTVKDLAMLMIIISDNMATDILYNMVGRDNLSARLHTLGLSKTRIPMTTRELLFSVVGLDVDDPLHTYAMATEKLFLRQFVMDSDGFSEEKSDVSSPNDMCRLLEMVHRGKALSDSSREIFFDIMKRQQLNNVLPLKLPAGVESAHKTGSYHGVRCDVGVVYAPNGPYSVAIMAKQVTGAVLETDLALAEVSRAIYDEFSG